MNCWLLIYICVCVVAHCDTHTRMNKRKCSITANWNLHFLSWSRLISSFFFNIYYSFYLKKILLTTWRYDNNCVYSLLVVVAWLLRERRARGQSGRKSGSAIINVINSLLCIRYAHLINECDKRAMNMCLIFIDERTVYLCASYDRLLVSVITAIDVNCFSVAGASQLMILNKYRHHRSSSALKLNEAYARH